MKKLPLRTEVKNALEQSAPGAFKWSWCTYTDKIAAKGKVVCRIKSERSVIRKLRPTERIKINAALKQLARRRGIVLQEVTINDPQRVTGLGTYKGDAFIYFNKPVNTDF